TSVMTAVRAGNRYMEVRAPWTLAKEGRLEELAQVLYTAAESLRIISGLLEPVMPKKMIEMRSALGINNVDINVSNLSTWGLLQEGSELSTISALFQRIEQEKSQEVTPQKSVKEKTSSKTENVVELIDISDVTKVDLKTAKICQATSVEGADRLLKLQIEVGGEMRQIIAGIAQFYKPEELIGKIIVIVANLKPVEIRGVESYGMLLAAKKKKKLALITVDSDDFPTGASVG
ncbi:MAG: methionine--tRNA ligase subunit beta, partial [Lentisphaeria bacterium]